MSTKATTRLAIVAIAFALQFYPATERHNPPPLNEIVAPADIDRVLRRACYDCHSNETRWPWYSYVAPASWLVAEDVHQARQRMNFSNWPRSMPPGIDCLFKHRIAELALNGEMPPVQYRLLHPSATLTTEDLALLKIWATDECGGARAQ